MWGVSLPCGHTALPCMCGHQKRIADLCIVPDRWGLPAVGRFVASHCWITWTSGTRVTRQRAASPLHWPAASGGWIGRQDRPDERHPSSHQLLGNSGLFLTCSAVRVFPMVLVLKLQHISGTGFTLYVMCLRRAHLVSQASWASSPAAMGCELPIVLCEVNYKPC